MKEYATIAAYIAAQPKERKAMLKQMRELITHAAPKANEAIKYGMPTYVGKGNLVHFAAMKGHLGFYPAPSAIDHFAKDLVGYDTSKGCVRFSYDKPLPAALITKMVRFRVKEDAKG